MDIAVSFLMCAAYQPNYFYPYRMPSTLQPVNDNEFMKCIAKRQKRILETGEMLSELLIAVNVISLVVLITYATRQYIFVFAALRHTELTLPFESINQTILSLY